MAKISALHTGDQQSLEIGTLGANFIYQISAYVEEFKTSHPDIHVHQKRLAWKQLNDELQSSKIDIAFSIWLDSIKDDYKNYHKLLIEKGIACVVASTAHPLAQRETVTIADLKNVPLALMDRTLEPHVYNQTIQLCQQNGFIPNIISEFPYIEPLLTLVEMNEAVTTTSTLAPIDRYHNLKKIKLEPEINMWMVMLWSPDNPNPAIEVFTENFKKAL